MFQEETNKSCAQVKEELLLFGILENHRRDMLNGIWRFSDSYTFWDGFYKAIGMGI